MELVDDTNYIKQPKDLSDWGNYMKVDNVSLRIAKDGIDVEVRFSDGQKYSVCTVDEDFPEIAEFLKNSIGFLSLQHLAITNKSEDIIDTGDIIRHMHSTHGYMVAYVSNGYIYINDWQYQCVKLQESILIKKATPEERMSLLIRMAKLPTYSHRRKYARKMLDIEVK